MNLFTSRAAVLLLLYERPSYIRQLYTRNLARRWSSLSERNLYSHLLPELIGLDLVELAPQPRREKHEAPARGSPRQWYRLTPAGRKAAKELLDRFPPDRLPH